MARIPRLGFRDDRWWAVGFVLFGAGGLLRGLATTYADADLWMHVRAGLDLWQAGRLPRHDPYSYLSGQTWINHTWLFDLVAGGLFDAGGAAALTWGRLAIVFGLAGLVWHAWRRAGWPVLPATLAAAVTMVACSPGLRTLRPQLLSYLLFAALLLILRRRHPRAMVAVVPVFVVWANVHGSVLLAVAAAAAWLLASIADRRCLPRWWDAGVIGLAALATLATPYGTDLWRFLLANVGPRLDLAEWQPIALPSVMGAVWLAAIAVGAVVVVRARERITPGLAAIWLLTAALPWLAERHLPYFVLVSALVVLPHVSREPDADVATEGRARRRLGQAAAAIGLALALAALPATSTVVVEGHRVPEGAVDWLRRQGARGRMVVPFDWGGYVIWHLGPQLRVSMDSRRETVYSFDVLRAHEALEAGLASPILDGRPDFVLCMVDSPLMQRLAGDLSWRLAYRDTTSAVWIDADDTSRPARPHVETTARPARVAFP